MHIVIWSAIAVIVFGVSTYMENSNSVCQFNESNYQKEKYDSPEHEANECLKAFHNVTMMFGFGAFGLGATLALIGSKQQKVNQQ